MTVKLAKNEVVKWMFDDITQIWLIFAPVDDLYRFCFDY